MLTPKDSLDALEDRFKLGLVNYKDKSWNAKSDQSILDNKDWILDRIMHGLAHLTHIQSVLFNNYPDNGDDDGAAIMWLGSMLHEAYIRQKNASTKD